MGVVDYSIRHRVKTLENRTYIFEVADLLIPQGEDWSEQGHSIGTLECEWNDLITYVSLIERDVVTADKVGMGFGESLERDNSLLSGKIADGQLWKEQLVDPPLTPLAFLAINRANAIPETPVTLHLYVYTYGPASVDIRVRARAAFFIL